MKALIPSLAAAVVAAGAIAMSPNEEKAPPGADEKIAEALPSEPYAKPAKPRRMLVFSRTNGFRHASIATGKIALAELGKSTGAFEAVISEDPADFERDRLARYDAVCFLSTTMNVFAPGKEEWEKMSDSEKDEAREVEQRRKKNLMDFVKSGRGFVGIHAATDTFYEWPEYGTMVNGFFDGHPWTADTPVSIRVEPGMEAHPLVAMLEGKNLEFKEEIYQFKEPYDSKSVTMLLRLDTAKTNMELNGVKRTDGDFGVAWARHWGKGRVFYCSIGHNHEMYWHPLVLRHYLAGIQWAMGDLDAEVKSKP